MYRSLICKYLSGLLICILILGMLTTAAFGAEQGGTCGKDLTWSLAAGTLTISGTGAMTDFSEQTMAPWYDRRGEIRSLSLPEGLTTIGSLAFYGCEELTVVNIPDTVTSIGQYAFAGCTGMTMLNLSRDLQDIEESAFSDCVSLEALQLPGQLRSIGTKAFYRCESLPAVTVPASVEYLGASAFGYCKSLVSAKVEARISVSPEWLFYGCQRLVSVTLPDTLEQLGEYSFRGCRQLTTVFYRGSYANGEDLKQWIGSDVPGFEATGHVTDAEAPDAHISGSSRDNGDGTVTQENVTAFQGSDVTSSVTMETLHREDGTGISSELDIRLTLENEQGWEQAKKILSDALGDYNSNTAQLEQKDEKIQINLLVKQGTVDAEFLEQIAQRNIFATVTMADGSRWRLDGNVLQEPQDWDLRYTLTPGSQELCQELGTQQCYVLRFLSPSRMNAELLLNLGKDLAQQKATLLYRSEELQQIQTGLVDQNGNAHFYLASVTDQGEYYVALELAETEDEPIVPQELLDSYGRPLRQGPIQYEITGVSSSFGMSFGQFTGMVVAVLAACIIVVGLVVYLVQKQNKKK